MREENQKETQRIQKYAWRMFCSILVCVREGSRGANSGGFGAAYTEWVRVCVRVCLCVCVVCMRARVCVYDIFFICCVSVCIVCM